MKINVEIFEYGSIPSRYKIAIPSDESYAMGVFITTIDSRTQKTVLLDGFTLATDEYNNSRVGRLIKAIQDAKTEIEYLRSAEHQLEVIKTIFNK
jgi:hypothetical protein